MNNRKIVKIIYDFAYTTENGIEYALYEVGKKHPIAGTPTSIEEHPSAGDGDKWYYDIIFDTGKVVRTFNPSEVTYE